jgi:hypothetical protein
VQNERLHQIIKELQRHRFGRRAETLPEDQMLLGLEDVEQAEANRAAEIDGSSPVDRQVRADKRKRVDPSRCLRANVLVHLWCANTPRRPSKDTIAGCNRENRPRSLSRDVRYCLVPAPRASSGSPLKANIARYGRHVSKMSILLQKSQNAMRLNFR